MILVDTSAWIDFFRGNGPLAPVVDELLQENEVALCGPVITELRRGFRTETARKRVLPLFSGCHLLSEPADLWVAAGDLGFLLARKGITARSVDLLIATYALSHAVALLSGDGDFAAMRDAGVPLIGA